MSASRRRQLSCFEAFGVLLFSIRLQTLRPFLKGTVSSFGLLSTFVCDVSRCLKRMSGQLRSRVNYVIGPDGSPLTVADLPPPGTRRWVIRRKAEVVAAVRGGLLSLEEACQRYTLTVEEYLSWQRSIDRHGLPGLRTTRIQHYRG